MTIEHYVECKVCHGSNNSMSRLSPGNNIPRSSSFREQNEKKSRVLPLRAGSFREPGELEKVWKSGRPPVPIHSTLKPDSPDSPVKLAGHYAHLKRRDYTELPSSTPNLHHISREDVRENREREHAVRRVRSFKTTTKGIVNRGDSFRKKGDRVLSAERIRYAFSPSPGTARRSPFDVQVEKELENPTNSSYFKIIVLGAHGVGKTSITQQFMTSDYVAFDGSADQGAENIVTVQLNGEESTLEFLDSQEEEINLETVKADAYLVVFSIAHRDTFDVATDLLSELRIDLGTDRTVILVGNKLDLVRKRKVQTQEALDVTAMYDAKYVEVSAGINHNIDELLVAMLAFIRFKLNPTLPQPTLRVDSKKSLVSGFSWKGPFNFFTRMFQLAKQKFTPSTKN